jgi:5-methyltetrahydrofolate--homocysteine methyltransferase
MKRSVAYLEPYMDKGQNDKDVRIILATVQGDVHDIGKNLVDIILSNNGYKVFNLGIKVPAETIITKTKEHKAHLVGLSGLLVKSAIVMQDSMPQYKDAGLNVPILLGGAALTRKFVAESCVPSYDQPVCYCQDAFAGLKAVREFEEGKLQATQWSTGENTVTRRPTAAANVDIDRTVDVPEAPFLGSKYSEDIDSQVLFKYINEQALFRGRWGYRRGKMSADEYTDLIEGTVKPMYQQLINRSLNEGLIRPKTAYGYYRCYSKEDTVYVDDNGKMFEFPFPRRQTPPPLCIADYFKTQEEGGDIAAFFVATIGENMDRLTHELYDGNEYHDYLIWHGFSVEVTDALAEYWHEVMRNQWHIEGDKPKDMTGYVTQEYRGARYGFGYPACPDLEAHKPVFDMLKPEAVGVTLTDNMQMVPEQSTSAIVVHHPQAKYFSV